MQNTYMVPVIHKVRAMQAVNANTYEEAVAFLLKHEENLPMPNNYSPIEGTLIVDGEEKFGKNIDALVASHEEAGVDMTPLSAPLRTTMFTDTITKL